MVHSLIKKCERLQPGRFLNLELELNMWPTKSSKRKMSWHKFIKIVLTRPCVFYPSLPITTPAHYRITDVYFSEVKKKRKEKEKESDVDRFPSRLLSFSILLKVWGCRRVLSTFWKTFPPSSELHTAFPGSVQLRFAHFSVISHNLTAYF